MADVMLLSGLIPVADMPLDLRLSVRQMTLRKILQGAQTNRALQNSQLIARELVGTDLGLTTHHWNELVSATLGTAETYEDSAISAVTGRDIYIGIYGVYVASDQDSISGLRFRVGGSRTHQWDLQQILHSEVEGQSREQRTLMIFPASSHEVDPVLIPPNTELVVQHYVRGAAAVGTQASELVYLGWVLEPVGGGNAGLQLQEL